jgi:tetratricopeptide (TPR) repeat protein
MKQRQLLVLLCSMLFAMASTSLCLAAPKKLSQKEKTAFNTAITQATNDFKTQDFAKALENYKQAYNIDNDPALLLAIGQCYRKLNKYLEAKDSYKLYLTAKPNSPDRASIEESIRGIERLIAQGTLEFSSAQDPGASVWIDDIPHGETLATPMVISGLEPGEHTLEVIKEGFAPYKKTFKLSPGQRQILGTSLEALPGTIEISTAQEDIGVYLDGILVGKSSPGTPLLLKTPQGKHQLLFSKKGFREQRQDAEVLAGKTLKISPTLEGGQGSIQVKINLIEAEILLDGKPMGKTKEDGTLLLTNVKAGEHTLLIKIPPFQTVTQTFILNDADVQEINYSFSASVTPKVFFGISGLSLLAGGVIVAATYDGKGLETSLANEDGFLLGVALIGTAIVSGNVAVILGVRQRARNLLKKQNQRKQKREQQKADEKRAESPATEAVRGS